MGVVRAEAIARMRVAFREGLSATKFISKMADIGLSYRRTDMLADWRNVNQIEAKEGRVRYVRKGYVPAKQTAEIKEWNMSREYMYKVKVQSRLRAGEPITDRFINIMSDKPLAVGQIESQVVSSWGEYEKYQPAELTGLQVWTAVQQVSP